MGAFIFSPDGIRQSGEKLTQNAGAFKANSENIFKTVDEMIHSAYISPEAMAIANKIYGYSEDLKRMYDTMERYGMFCQTSAAKMERNQAEIIARQKY